MSLLLIEACGALQEKEIARLEVNGISTENHIKMREVTLDLQKGDEVSFWSEMDMSYQGHPTLIFRILIFKDGIDYGSLDLDPREKTITFDEEKVTENNTTHWKFGS